MMVQIVIHSSKGKVLATPMACVDLEKSIPENKPFVINEDDTSTDPVDEDDTSTDPVDEDNKED